MRQLIAASVFMLVIGSPSVVLGQDDCHACLRQKLETAKAKAVAATAIGALGGARAGAVGAACGAILGAVAGGVDALIELGQCSQICKQELAAKKDPESGKCEELLKKVTH
ncbi:hypothetical protein [Bradyrhizobium sp. SZCCHNRI3043]|uniref:hypothetical protein n=1 Tax=Bradyrhizobium sp. SZCCHNRI3043 TaxID=3057292 RepID=UPI0028EC08B1|nr:hypothetical protein [Bradyrhizobium sp. SZCCHNRI3043]